MLSFSECKVNNYSEVLSLKIQGKKIPGYILLYP